MKLAILSVAEHLGIKYKQKGIWHMALCCCHDDHTPSMGLNATTNRWRCFACGKSGNAIELVMKHENLSYADALKWLQKEFGIEVVPQQQQRPSLFQTIQSLFSNMKPQTTSPLSPSPQGNTQPSPLWREDEGRKILAERFGGTSNEFTRALVQTGILTPSQMAHATQVFRLSTVSDSVIFWQMDASGDILEGKVMYYQANAHRSHTRKPVTVSWLLKKSNQLGKEWKALHCLFGLHQLKDLSPDSDAIISVVESEKTAIICNELIPTLALTSASSQQAPVVWMATGGLTQLTTDMLRPLVGHRVILFPDTDPQGHAYAAWLQVAADAQKQLGHTFTVSSLLEHHASADQKQRKIDIADFLLEALT